MNAADSCHDICVDASLAIKWLVKEPYSDKADALFRAANQRAEVLIAPPLLYSEITNILRQRMRQAEAPLSLPEAVGLLELFLTISLDILTPPDLYQRALTIADTYRLPAAYDAQYVALAELCDADLWTADARLLRELGGHLPFVKSLADFEA